MGYTHYWHQFRAFTASEWKQILGEAKRIVAKAARGGYYGGKEDVASQSGLEVDHQGFRTGFKEDYAWRTFPHPDQPIPCQGVPILIAGPGGQGMPIFNQEQIALNGKAPHDYESFVLERDPRGGLWTPEMAAEGVFNFCKTEYRAYDAVVVSILAAARLSAPKAIRVSSDGGPEAIRYLF
jgi:hypothetical protein